MNNLTLLRHLAQQRWWRVRYHYAILIGLAGYSIGLSIVIIRGHFLGVDTGNIYYLISAGIGLGAAGIYLATLRMTKHYYPISTQDILLHINRTLPQIEESAHLLATPDVQLNSLQCIQKSKANAVLFDNWAFIVSTIKHTFPLTNYKRDLAFVVMVAISISGLNIMLTETPTVAQSPGITTNNYDKPATYSVSVEIEPPAYTAIPAFISSDLNITAPQGSSITWVIESPFEPSFELQVDGGQPASFKQRDDGIYEYQYLAEKSTLYSFDSDSPLPSVFSGIHTLRVIQDKKPFIQIIEPSASVTSFAKNDIPQLFSQVVITDDYGVDDVYIQASIAQGTGEAVKFRDQRFLFSSQQSLEAEQGVKYRFDKEWSLLDLSMEPGDELYFSVIATDNRAPQKQLTQSRTLIVKWLDEDASNLVSDGILIDFMPEYFKSQRQIIIETMELIEAKDVLPNETFEQTSRDLAIAQSDLKQRYGQYLGDEFETGVLQTMEAGPAIPHEHEGDKHSHSDRESLDDHQHEHNSRESAQDKSGYTQVIEQFGHNHGEAEIGFMALKNGQVNPKVLMKQSIGYMWQAELMLHMAQPSQALPFEEKALEYLNRARKAERVYVNRLGFEPPPVTEDRRYEGDLTDIVERHVKQDIELPETMVEQQQKLIERLSFVINQPMEFIESDMLLLEAVKQGLRSTLSDTDDTQVLNILASIEQLLVSRQWQPNNCMQCATELFKYLWKKADTPLSVPNKISPMYDQAIQSNYEQSIGAMSAAGKE